MANIYADKYDVQTLHAADPYAEALERHGILRKRLEQVQRKSVTPMHAGHPRRDRARFQREGE